MLVITQLVILWKGMENMLDEVLGNLGGEAIGDIMEVVGEHVV